MSTKDEKKQTKAKKEVKAEDGRPPVPVGGYWYKRLNLAPSK